MRDKIYSQDPKILFSAHLDGGGPAADYFEVAEGDLPLVQVRSSGGGMEVARTLTQHGGGGVSRGFDLVPTE